jgi:TolB protein
MLKTVKRLMGLLLVCCLQTSYAALNLELTQGVDRAIPLAAVTFAGQTIGPNLADIIQGDLKYSGRFKILASEQANQQPHTPAEVNYGFWRNQGVDNLVVGSVTPIVGGRFKVSFALLDVINTSPNGQHVLLQQDFTTGAEGMRRLAHHMSDLIYQKLVGVRGVFSTKIAYVLIKRWPNRAPEYRLEIADMDGFNPRTLLVSSSPIMSPSWSADGKQIAYVSFENRRSGIYLSDVASGSRRLVSSFPGINGAPAFSPNSRQLAMVLSKEDKPKIYVKDLIGDGVRQITDGWSIDTEPRWSPDGNAIIFTSDRGGSPQIYRVEIATGSTTRLTYNGNYNARASYTPDGSGLVMIHREDGQYYIALQDIASGRVILLSTTGYDQSPSIAPNGSMVIYATQAGGRPVLGISSTDGRVKIRLPARDGDVQEPAWSPFLG